MRTLPHVLNDEEIERVIDAIPPRNKRDKALFMLMSATAMRVSEAISLEAAKLNLEFNMLLVMGKGRKERYIPFTDEAGEACRSYEREKEARGIASVYFFVSRQGGQLSRQYVWQLFKRYGELAMITKPIFPHVFRHSKATSLLDCGMDLRHLQEFLGHSSVDTTQIYTHVSRKRLKQVHCDFHPRG